MKSVLLSLIFLILISAFSYAVKSFTPPIFSKNAVAQLRAIDVNGDKQYVLIRGHDKRAPVLLFLHGGPGMPAMYLAHDFQRELEKHFVIVHWDQRGAGKSYRKDISPGELKISQLLADTTAVLDFIQNELGAEKVWLAGHSHGSYLGALYAKQYPERLHAFIGIGQTTNPAREVEVQDTFLKTQLEKLRLPAETIIDGSNREDLLFKTHSELYDSDSFIPLLMSGLKAAEYSLFDSLNIAKGSSFSSRHMTYDVAGHNIYNIELKFEIPVIIMMGAYDMVTPTELAREFFDIVEAPEKVWIEFERSAHFPFFEEPGKFTEELEKLKNTLDLN